MGVIGQNVPTGISPVSSLEPTKVYFETFHQQGNGFYDVEVDTTSNFNSLYYRKVEGIVDYSAENTGVTILDSIDNLYYGKTYYWRTRSRSASDTSAWSAALEFTTLDEALFLAPAPNSTVPPSSFTVWASHKRGNKDYIIEASQNSGFTYPIYYRESSLAFLLNPNIEHNTTFATILNGMPLTGELFIRMMTKNDVDSSLWSQTVRVVIDESLSVEDYIKDVISVYPNPTNGILNISAHQSIQHLNVIDVNGKVVYSQVIDQEKSINLGSLPNGFYMISFQTDKGIKYQKIRIIK